MISLLATGCGPDYERERCECRKAKGLCPILLQCQCPSASTSGLGPVVLSGRAAEPHGTLPASRGFPTTGAYSRSCSSGITQSGLRPAATRWTLSKALRNAFAQFSHVGPAECGVIVMFSSPKRG